jgi:S1-C subfamily serine protease
MNSKNKVVLRIELFFILVLCHGCISTYNAKKFEKNREWRAAYNEINIQLHKEPESETLIQLRLKYGNIITNEGIDKLTSLDALNLSGRLEIINDIYGFVSDNKTKLELELENTSKKQERYYNKLKDILLLQNFDDLVEGVLDTVLYIENDSKAKSLSEEYDLVKRLESHYKEILFSHKFEEAQEYYDKLTQIEKIWKMGICSKLYNNFIETRLSYVKNYLNDYCKSQGHDLMVNVLDNSFGSDIDLGQNNIRLVVYNSENKFTDAIKESSIDNYRYQIAKDTSEIKENDLAYMEIRIFDYGNEPEFASETKLSKYKSGTRSVLNPDYLKAKDRYSIILQDYNFRLRNYQVEYAKHQRQMNQTVNDDFDAIVSILNALTPPKAPSTAKLNNASAILQNTPSNILENIYTPYSYKNINLTHKYHIKFNVYSCDFTGETIFDKSSPITRKDRVKYNFNHGVQSSDDQVEVVTLSREKTDADYNKFLSESFISIHQQFVSQIEPRLSKLFFNSVHNNDSYTAHRSLLSMGTLLNETGYIHDFIPDLFALIRNGLNKPDAYAHYLQFSSKYLFDRTVGLSEIQGMLKGPLIIKSFSEKNINRSAPQILSLDPTETKQTGLGQLDHVIKSTLTIKTKHGSGTGFVFHKPNLVITNYHVVGDSTEVRAYDHDGNMFLAKVIETAITRDLALLQINANHFKPIQAGNSNELKSGVSVYAVGSPDSFFGTLQHSVSKGIFSASRVFKNQKFLQTDAPINPGNSGGPLVLENGKIVGINTLKDPGREGLGLSIPVEEIFTNLHFEGLSIDRGNKIPEVAKRPEHDGRQVNKRPPLQPPNTKVVSATASPSVLPQETYRSWTNTEGITIQARFVSIGKETVTIFTKNQNWKLKLTELSEESRQLASQLGELYSNSLAPSATKFLSDYREDLTKSDPEHKNILMDDRELFLDLGQVLNQRKAWDYYDNAYPGLKAAYQDTLNITKE